MANNGIPLWFRCFKSKHNPDAYNSNLIKDGISFCKKLFPSDCHIIFLADRWFPSVDVLSFIQDIGSFFCFRAKSYFTFSYYDNSNCLVTKHLRDINPWSHSARYFENVFFSRKLFKTTIVATKAPDSDDPWFIITNDKPNRAVRNYSYRFGSIETIFKNQKSNRI